MVSFLSVADFQKVVHTFIYLYLNYCNVFYLGISHGSLHCLQWVQNTSACLITGTERYDHITPVLVYLHCLPVTFHIDFEILLLTFKALNGLVPKYMCDLLTWYVPPWPLKANDRALLVTHRSWLVTGCLLLDLPRHGALCLLKLNTLIH